MDAFQGTCNACFDMIIESSLHYLKCGHPYCENCWKQMSDSAEEEKREIECFRCLNPELFAMEDLRQSFGQIMNFENNDVKNEEMEDNKNNAPNNNNNNQNENKEDQKKENDKQEKQNQNNNNNNNENHENNNDNDEIEIREVKLTESMELYVRQCDDIILCPNKKCRNVYEKVPPTAQQMLTEIVKDDRGVKITGEALEHYFHHRFRCTVCGTNFCSFCDAVPYHIGFTCEMLKEKGELKECRYCEQPLPPMTPPYFSHNGKGIFYVCQEDECTQKAGFSCLKVLECGHPCGGVLDEDECLRCLHPDCCKDSPNNQDYCSICYTDYIGCAPSVQLPCSHIFHFNCLQYRINEGYSTPFITFKFASCPLCDAPINHPKLDLKSVRELERVVRKKAVERAIIEGLDKDPHVLEGGAFEGKLEEYAMAKLAFYECFKCKEPYYGGMRQCDPGANVQQDEGVRNLAKQDRICVGCSGIKASCDLHGSEYYEFKCRFCCNIATFFCGGACHYCDPCHEIAGQLTHFSDWSTNWSCDKIKECPGPDQCPLKMRHARNGEEFAIGCVICKANNEKAAQAEEEKKKG